MLASSLLRPMAATGQPGVPLIGVLVTHLMEQVNREAAAEPGYREKTLSAGARNLLLAHPWPGNVRELLNTLRRAAIWSEGSSISTADAREAILPTMHARTAEILGRPLGEGLDLQQVLTDVARHYLERAMVEAGAQIILVPACTEFVSGYHRIRTSAMARALEGTCASVVSPTVGDSAWSPAVDYNNGAAGIYAPAENGLSDTGILAEGVLNAPGWVHATVDLAALARLADAGEMRNRADWRLQPGGALELPPTRLIDLT